MKENILLSFESFAKELIIKHNLIDWKLVWDTKPTTNRLGQCRYKKKEIGISLKSALILPENQVKDTILHEIAHALTPGHHHDNIWKNKCRELGCRPERYADVKLDSLYKYKGACSHCNSIKFSNRNLNGNIKNYICVPCMNKYYHKHGNSDNYRNYLYFWELNLVETNNLISLSGSI